jgi:hypothetical protein
MKYNINFTNNARYDLATYEFQSLQPLNHTARNSNAKAVIIIHRHYVCGIHGDQTGDITK